MADAQVKGEVQAVVFHNVENGWGVVRLRCPDQPGLVSAVGVLGSLTPGASVELFGRWVEHPKFGRQFEAERYEVAYPATEHGVVKFLSSQIKGVGEVLARRMVDAFGVGVLDVLDNDPDQLVEVKGISPGKLKTMVESWGKQHDVKNLIVFLNTYNIPATYAGKIHKLHGQDAVARIKENPYDLAYEIRGVGFKRADDMALKLGMDPRDIRRLQAALVFVLFTESERAGHMYLPQDKLFKAARRLLGEEVSDAELAEALLALSELKRVLLEDGDDGERAVYLPFFFRYEKDIASRTQALATHAKPVSRSKVAEVLPKVEAKLGMELSGEQREAVFASMVNKVFIITGGPGTGKTTITRAVVQTLSKLGLKVKLAAPTGRAAKRLAEATGKPAKTVHRLLQYVPDTGGFYYCEDRKLKCEALIVDEASMLDAHLTVSLLRALPATSRLILVGDVNQLPSVGPGNVLGDMLASGVVEHARLTHIFRQAQQSMIVVNAHNIIHGRPPVNRGLEPPDEDFFWINLDEPARVRDMIVQMVCERIPARFGLDPVRDVQVLSPMHKGEVGTVELNSLLQERLNPGAGYSIVRGRNTYRSGDRVLALRNNYEKDVFNGDLGWVVEVDPDGGEMLCEFDGRHVAYESMELDEVAPAYAISVHKSQGSEYPAVVVPVVSQHYIMLRRNLIYTALTRARRLAVLIGSDKAMRIALSHAEAGKRHSRLAERLRRVFDSSMPGL